MNVLARLKKIFVWDRIPRVDIKKQFDILGKVGQGSMSKVYRARDNRLGRIVCLKVLDKLKTARFEARFPGLKRPTEGLICLTMRHPNVVRTYDQGLTTNDEQFLAMEFIDGMGLNFLIETKSPQLSRNKINYLIQLVDGLEYIHQQGYLHRDICPRNAMVTKDDLLRIIDFGLSVPNTPAFRRSGNRTGTPSYLAPEIIKRLPTDRRVDLFALGVTAYEVLTGNLPWKKTQSLETILDHVNRPGSDPRVFCPDLDPKIVQFLIKAIEREPARRFQSAAEFREALKTLPLV